MRKKREIVKLKNPVKFLCIIIFFSFFIIHIISQLQLPKISKSTNTNVSEIGKFGGLLIEMLPRDLKFTLLLPSEKAIHRNLRLVANDSNSYAALTRVLGFSALPRWICTGDLEYGKEIVYDSISGFNLYFTKDLKGRVLVNGVVAEEVDLKMGNLLVHVMDGVVMDSEFEESMLPDDEDGN